MTTIGQILSGPASVAHADAIEKALGPTRRYTQGAVAGLPAAWGECDLIVSHLALGATARLVAQLLHDKASDPGVVVVDEAGRFAIPLVGGHAGGANDLARRVADALGAQPVLSTATDALGVPGLDTLGWAWSGDVAGVTRSILDGRTVEVVRTRPWPLPVLPANVQLVADLDAAAEPAARLVVSDETDAAAGLAPLPTVTLRPPSLVVGMGCNAGTSAQALRALVDAALAAAGLAPESIAQIVSVDAKADEPGLVELARDLGVALRTFAADELAGIAVPNPSEAPERAVGTPSVAEASVLAAGADLIVEKTKTREATCAIGRLPARGKLFIVGLGPGSLDLLTPRAREALRSASVVVGFRPYVNYVKSILRPGTQIFTSPMGKEEVRTSAAIDFARQGRTVALVSSGDAGVYAMASPTLEQGTQGIDVEIVPGVTASLAVGAVLGAPLGHDHATISLSDLHTDWEVIVRRVRAAAEGDFVTVFYNPRSRKRLHHLPDALAILAQHRPPTTPVAIVTDGNRAGQKVVLSTLADVNVDDATMNALVIVGSSTTRYVPSENGPLMVTPRDYHWMNDDAR